MLEAPLDPRLVYLVLATLIIITALVGLGLRTLLKEEPIDQSDMVAMKGEWRDEDDV